MSLFGSLFGQAAPKAVGSGLFSSSSKYAVPGAAGDQHGAAPPAAAPAAQAGGKKRRKPAAAEPPAAEAPPKKRRKDKGQQDAAAPAAAKKKGQRREGGGTAAAATQEAANEQTAAAAPAGKPVLGLGQPDGKPAKQGRPVGPAATAAPEQPRAAGKAAKKGDAKVAAAPDDRLPRTVFVGNLPGTVKRKSLARLFAACGAVESCRLRSLPLKREPESKVPRRGAIASGAIDADHSAHAYVVFKEEAAVEAALALNMQEFEGHHLRVDRAAAASAKGAVVFDPQRSLFVGNLPLDVEDEEVIQHFGAGCVEAVRVVRDGRTGAGKGVCFVLFRTQDASRAALKQRDGAEIKGRRLRITRVQKQADGKAAWQQGASAKGGGGKKAAARPVAGKRKTGGKRPAVAARKQQQQPKRQRRE